MNVAIVGSRDYPLMHLISGKVRDLHRESPAFVLVSGGARGVDRVAEAEAERLGHDILSYRPRGRGKSFVIDLHSSVGGEETVEKNVSQTYASYGQAAFGRNELIVFVSHKVVAFWDETSSGTAHSIKLARDAHKPLLVYGRDGRLLP